MDDVRVFFEYEHMDKSNIYIYVLIYFIMELLGM